MPERGEGARGQGQLLRLGHFVGNLKRCGSDNFGHGPAAETLGANKDRFVGTGGGADLDALQIRPELPPADTGDFRADAAQVLLLTASPNRVAELGALTAYVTFPSHRTTSCKHRYL